MIQWVLTILILSFALWHTAKNFYSFFTKPITKCNCSGSCGIKAELMKNKLAKPLKY